MGSHCLSSSGRQTRLPLHAAAAPWATLETAAVIHSAAPEHTHTHTPDTHTHMQSCL